MSRRPLTHDQFHFEPDLHQDIQVEDFVRILVQIADSYSHTRAYKRAKKRKQRKQKGDPS